MTDLQSSSAQTRWHAEAVSRWDDEGGARKLSSASAFDATGTMPIAAPHSGTRLIIDESQHNRDGLLLRGWDADDAVTITAFLSRKVIDAWIHGQEMLATRNSLSRSEYTALGRLNLPAIERIVTAKYQRGGAFNYPYPFVDILLADILSSGEALDLAGLPALLAG